jgi:peroxiredoxin
MAAGSRGPGMLEAGSHAPLFELKDLQGSSRTLAQLLERGPVLLSFFKVSCPVCQLTFPYLERLSKNEAVQVIGISQDNAAATRAFNERFGVTFLTLLDEGAGGYPVSNAFCISSVPSLFLIETDGSISASFSGFSKPRMEELGKRVNVVPFLAQDSVPQWKAG